MLAFWILVPVFAALGIYLWWFSRRLSALLGDFAAENGYSLSDRAEPDLETTLSDSFDLEEDGLTRSFERIRDIVRTDDGILLFRAVELLDTNPYGSSENSHNVRVVVLVDIDAGFDLFALVSPNGRIQNRLGGRLDADDETVAGILDVIDESPPRCPISITVRDGTVLMYLEPRVAGQVLRNDLDYLLDVGRGLRRTFGSR
jgi:hypothetical protein